MHTLSTTLCVPVTMVQRLTIGVLLFPALVFAEGTSVSPSSAADRHPCAEAFKRAAKDDKREPALQEAGRLYAQANRFCRTLKRKLNEEQPQQRSDGAATANEAESVKNVPPIMVNPNRYAAWRRTSEVCNQTRTAARVNGAVDALNQLRRRADPKLRRARRICRRFLSRIERDIIDSCFVNPTQSNCSAHSPFTVLIASVEHAVWTASSRALQPKKEPEKQ